MRQRFRDPNKKTLIYLPHPSSPALAILARRIETEVEVIQACIKETVHLLNQLRLPSTQLEIRGHYLFNTYSVSLGDTYGILAPFYIGRGMQTQPLYIFQNRGPGCLYERIKEDLERLREDLEDVSSIA